jgi:hypothetical protein
MHKHTLLSLFSISLVAGCGGANNANTSSSDDSHASAALESNGSTSTESALIVASVDGTQLAASANEAAGMASASLKTQFQPASCVVSVTVTGNSLTYTLKDCSGPWGLVHVSGTVVAAYDKQADGIHAELKASGLTVNGATLNLDSQAVFSVNGSSKQLVVKTDGDGVGFFGTQLARHGSYTLTWDSASQCAQLNGNWSTTIGNDTWSTSVSSFKQCKGLCPVSGTIAHTGGITGVTITVTFDGSADAKWTSSNGRKGDLIMLCIP